MRGRHSTAGGSTPACGTISRRESESQFEEFNPWRVPMGTTPKPVMEPGPRFWRNGTRGCETKRPPRKAAGVQINNACSASKGQPMPYRLPSQEWRVAG